MFLAISVLVGAIRSQVSSFQSEEIILPDDQVYGQYDAAILDIDMDDVETAVGQKATGTPVSWTYLLNQTINQSINQLCTQHILINGISVWEYTNEENPVTYWWGSIWNPSAGLLCHWVAMVPHKLNLRVEVYKYYRWCRQIILFANSLKSWDYLLFSYFSTL